MLDSRQVQRHLLLLLFAICVIRAMAFILVVTIGSKSAPAHISKMHPLEPHTGGIISWIVALLLKPFCKALSPSFYVQMTT